MLGNVDLIKLASKITDKVNTHFSSEEKDKWKQFIQDLKSPKFRQLSSNHELADDKLKLFIKNVGKHIASKSPGTIVQGTKDSYTVKSHKDGSYTCSCPQWTYRGSVQGMDCKHIDKVRMEKTAQINNRLVKTAATKVSPYQQESQSSCAAACLKSVLNSYGHQITELEAALEIGVKKNRGAETTDIVKAAKDLGFDAYEQSLTWEEAEALISKDIPIICDIQSFNKKNSGHYVVMTDIQGDRVHIMDPNTPGNKRELSKEEFEQRWHDRAMEPPHKLMLRWGVVVKPKLEKQAILGTMALTGGLHMGANALMKGLRGSHLGHKIEAAQMATGLRHAVAGKTLNPIAKNIANYGIGPESMMSYQAGSALGETLQGAGKGKQYKYLKKLRKNVAMTDSLKGAPITKDIVPAVNRVLQNRTSLMDKIPTVDKGAKTTLLQRGVSAGLGALAISADPHSALHMGVNALRDQVSKSRMGETFAKKQFKDGLTKGAPSPLMSNISDILISPAAMDARRFASSTRDEALNPKAMRLLKSTMGSSVQLPQVRDGLTNVITNMATKDLANPNMSDGARKAVGGVYDKALDLTQHYVPSLTNSMNQVKTNIGNIKVKKLTKPNMNSNAMLGEINPQLQNQLTQKALARQATWKPQIEVSSR